MMIDKNQASQLVFEIAERVKALRQLLRDSTQRPDLEDEAFAGDLRVLATATRRLAEKCGATLP